MKTTVTSLQQRPRRRLLKSLVTLMMLNLMTPQITATPKVRRITFKRGATTANVTGRLNGWNDKEHFVIRLRANQTMTLSVEGKCEDCYAEIAVDVPTGANDTVDTDMCLCRVEVTKTIAGDYRITVGENRKGENWKGSFVLRVEVH